MKKNILTFRSFTDAMKAKRALASIGLPLSGLKLASETEGGCRYGIRVPEQHGIAAFGALRRAGIPYHVSDYDLF